jgi:hypothetical protein
LVEGIASCLGGSNQEIFSSPRKIWPPFCWSVSIDEVRAEAHAHLARDGLWPTARDDLMHATKGSRSKAPPLPSQLVLSQSQRLGHSSFQAAGRLVVASTSPPPGTAKPVTTRRLSSARCGDGNRIAPGGSDPPDVRCVLPCPTAYRSPLITLILMLPWFVHSRAPSRSPTVPAGA